MSLNAQSNSTIGCSLIGIIIGTFLYGITCAQTLYYMRRYTLDRIWLKLLVALLWSLDTARTIMELWCIWVWNVTNHSNPFALLIVGRNFLYAINKCTLTDFSLTFPLKADFFLEGVTTLIVQMYFIYCIWKVAEHRQYQLLLTITVGLMCLISFGFCIATICNLEKNSSIAVAIQNAAVPGCTHILMAGIADVYIAVSLSLILHRKRTGFYGTDHMIMWLVLYMIHRGIVVALVQLLEFATFLGTLNASPFELIWLAFHYPGSKLYVNSLFALLNMRDYFKSDRPGGYVGDNVLLSINQGGQAGYRQNSYAMQVQVETTTTAETR